MRKWSDFEANTFLGQHLSYFLLNVSMFDLHYFEMFLHSREASTELQSGETGCEISVSVI